ncbi:MAG: SHOCT domain-containing protein [Streptosporangiaceae bacterium]
MIMRRRPLLRAAAVGGSAYLVGKRAGQRNADQQETESAQAGGASGQGSQGGQAQQPAPAAASGAAASIPDQLNRLSALHDQGALTDAEFASAKSKLLGT